MFYPLQADASKSEKIDLVTKGGDDYAWFPANEAMEPIIYNDAFLYGRLYQGAQSIAQSFIDFLFPISGKEKRVEFLTYPFYGQKKPQYRKFNWKSIESQHFVFLTYDYDDIEGDDVLKSLINIFELKHEDNSDLFGVDNRIKKKIPIILYKSRSDFEQTHIQPGLIPETLGGFTEVMSWNRVIIPFEGDKTTFEHVARHEGTHLYHVAKKPSSMPLWFLEGSSEMNSIKWDAQAETTIRDAYFYDYLFHIKDLWQIQGTWLMYKEGNYIVNYIADNFGKEAIRKIFDNSRKMSFAKNIKASLGIDLDELDRRIFARLNADYGQIGKDRDDVDESREVMKGRLLASRKGFFITGKYNNGKFELILHYEDAKRGVVSKKIVSDFEFNNESLHLLKSRVGLSDNEIVYAIDAGRNDVLRVLNYSYDPNKGHITLGEHKEFKWDNISPVQDPVFIDGKRIAFVGFEKGYSGIYIYDRDSGKLEKITTDRSFYRDLDYSTVRKVLVFSKEEERLFKPSAYNSNLYLYDIVSRSFKKITDSEYNDTEPKISPDGKKIAFVGDRDDVFNINLFDMESGKTVKATDVRVTAFSPMWRDDEKLFFNTVKRLETYVQKMKVPTLKIAFGRSLPKPSKTFYTKAGDDIALAKEFEEGQGKSEEFKSKFRIDGERLFLTENGRSYTVKNFVPGDKGFVIFAETEKIDYEKEKREEVFHYSAPTLTKITRDYSYRGKLDATIANVVNAFRKDRSVIAIWVSPDLSLVFILVNNKLSFEKAKGAQSLHLVDVQKGEIGALPYYEPLSNLNDKVERIYFLKGDRYLFEVQKRKWDGGYYREYHLYDRAKSAFKRVFKNSREVLISLDSRYVMDLPDKMWGNSEIGVYDSATNDRKVVYRALGGEDIVNAHFIDGNRIFVALKGIGKVGVKYIDVEGKKEFEKYFGLTAGYNFTVAMSSLDGTLSAIKIVDLNTKTKTEKLYLYEKGKENFEEIGSMLSYYDNLVFAGDMIVFQGRDIDNFPSLYSYKKGVLKKGYAIESARYSSKADKLVMAGGEDLVAVDLKEALVIGIAEKSFGFDVYGDSVVFSSFIEGYYNLFRYDLKKKELKRITRSWFNELTPRLSDEGALAYTADEGKRFSIHLRKNMDDEKAERIFMGGGDVYNPVWKDRKLYFNVLEMPKKEEKADEGEKRIKDRLWNALPLEFTLKPTKVAQYIRPEYIYGGAAYDGESALIFISMTADNIFSNRGIYVNTIYKSDFVNSTVGYTDLENGRTFTFYMNRLEDNEYGGLQFMKTYLIDKFQEFNLYSELEIQHFKPDEFEGDLVDIPGKSVSQLVIKSGAVYSFDSAVWDEQGPARGSRAFVKLELGINTKTGKISNFDGNVDFRLYNLIARRVAFAHRVMAGMSLGDYPTVYYMGGNISFRGVQFDELTGNNYWVFNEELRIPFFDILGGKLPDPVDSALGPFFRFFDVRGGLYFDVGQIWFNRRGELDELLYSFGVFFNTPTLFGLTMRFSKGLIGEKDFNLWFGYNW